MIAIFASTIWALSNEKKITIDEAMDFVKNLGVESVEIGSDEFRVHPKDKYKELIDSHGLGICCVHHSCRYTSNDDGEFISAINHTKKIIDDTVSLGAQYFMLVPSYPDDINGMEDKERARLRMTEAIKETVAYVKNKPITIIIENFSILQYPFSTIDDLQYITENIPDVKLNLDVGNFRCVNNDVLQAYERLKSNFVFCHIKDWQCVDDGGILTPDGKHLVDSYHGKGILPLRALLDEMCNANYKGWFVIEQSGPDLYLKLPVSVALIKEFDRSLN